MPRIRSHDNPFICVLGALTSWFTAPVVQDDEPDEKGDEEKEDDEQED